MSASKRSAGRQPSRRNRANVEAIKVAVRVRPFNQRELHSSQTCVVSMNDQATTVQRANQEPKTFGFDHSYWSHDGFQANANGRLEPAADTYADQERIFADLGQPMVNSSLQGFNGMELNVCSINMFCCSSFVSVWLALLQLHPEPPVAAQVASSAMARRLPARATLCSETFTTQAWCHVSATPCLQPSPPSPTQT